MLFKCLEVLSMNRQIKKKTNKQIHLYPLPILSIDIIKKGVGKHWLHTSPPPPKDSCTLN